MKKLLYPLMLILILIIGCDFVSFAGNESPVAYIDSISPSDAASGETVTFVGHGTDADGTVVAYRWRSSIDGDLSVLATLDSSELSGGEHTIYLKVQDNNGAWSDEVESTIMVGAVSAGPTGEGAFESEPGAPSETTTPTALPVISSFTASPATIAAGGSSMLSYDVSNADSITFASTTGTKVSTLLHSSGSIPVEPPSTTTYTITATNAAGSVTATAKVTVQASTEKTVTLSLVTAESGSISSDHVVGPKLITGDAGTNKTFWAYFSFNISTLAGKDIVEAELLCSPTSLNGRPWPNLVSLGVYQINHGPRPLQPSDFTFVGPIIVDGLGQLSLLLPVDVTSQVQSAASARAPRFQVRINFVKMTNNDGQPDNISWTSTTPKLRVTYR